jgi:hypothetical protein
LQGLVELDGFYGHIAHLLPNRGRTDPHHPTTDELEDYVDDTPVDQVFGTPAPASPPCTRNVHVSGRERNLFGVLQPLSTTTPVPNTTTTTTTDEWCSIEEGTEPETIQPRKGERER